MQFDLKNQSLTSRSEAICVSCQQAEIFSGCGKVRVFFIFTSGFGEGAPAALAVAADVVDEALILVLGPSPSVRVRLLAAR